MREIRESPEFLQSVAKLGPRKTIDEALSPVMFALSKNPYAFPLLENDWIRVRYAKTKPSGKLPALVVVFTITDRDTVELVHVEKAENY